MISSCFQFIVVKIVDEFVCDLNDVVSLLNCVVKLCDLVLNLAPSSGLVVHLEGLENELDLLFDPVVLDLELCTFEPVLVGVVLCDIEVPLDFEFEVDAIFFSHAAISSVS